MRHDHFALNLTSFLITALLILAHFLFPSVITIITPWMLIVSVVVIGIPHGAIDHVVAAEMYNLGNSFKDHLLFYSSYLAVMILIGALWIFLPVWGMILFLLISIYHFGQSDAEALLKGDKGKSNLNSFWLFVRGTTIIGLIVFSHPDISIPVLSDAMRIKSGVLSFINTYSIIAVWIIIGINILGTLLIITLKTNSLTVSKTQFLLDGILLITLFYFLNPLLSFAIYFALWHSAGHVSEMLTFFKHRGNALSLSDFYKLAMPFTLISFAGLFILAGLQQLLSIDNQLITILFILISVLTLPHMFVADRMLRHKRNT